MKNKVNIIPVKKVGEHRTGGLKDITVEQINQILGFKPNCEEDSYKVNHSWGFKINGVHCGVWDYKGSEKYNSFSTYGPAHLLKLVFGEHYVD